MNRILGACVCSYECRCITYWFICMHKNNVHTRTSCWAMSVSVFRSGVVPLMDLACIYAYTYMCVPAHVHTCVCLHICIHGIYAYMCVPAHMHTCVCMKICWKQRFTPNPRHGYLTQMHTRACKTHNLSCIICLHVSMLNEVCARAIMCMCMSGDPSYMSWCIYMLVHAYTCSRVPACCTCTCACEYTCIFTYACMHTCACACVSQWLVPVYTCARVTECIVCS